LNGKSSKRNNQAEEYKNSEVPITVETFICCNCRLEVKGIKHNNPVKGYADWNLTSDVGQPIASGIYLFTIEDKKNGKVQVGKFVVIK